MKPRVLLVRPAGLTMTSNLENRVATVQQVLSDTGVEHREFVFDTAVNFEMFIDSMELYDFGIFFSYMTMRNHAVNAAETFPHKRFVLVTGAPCDLAWIQQVGLDDRPPNLDVRRLPDDPSKASQLKDMVTKIIADITQPA